MFVKSFVLRSDNLQSIVGCCTIPGTISVIRPEKALTTLFRAVIDKMLVNKQSAIQEFHDFSLYFEGLSRQTEYLQRKSDFLHYVQDYLHKATSYNVPATLVEDYVMAQSALLCAQAVAYAAEMEVLDGRELVICNQEDGKPVFDWESTRLEIERRCNGKTHIVIAGGYARTPRGEVFGIGKGGANMMASLVASALGADSIEFYVEDDGINGIASMTYDEAAHYCASKTAPFPSAALWPAKQADIPIIVKSISHPDFVGTVISSTSKESLKEVSGVVIDRDLDLVTIYGTGLLGNIGTSSTIFSALAKDGINIRFISQTSSEFAISFAVKSLDRDKVTAAINTLVVNNPLMPLDDVMMINREVAILTVYGSRMKNVPGISGKVFSLLGAAGVNVIASAQGGEELSISVVIDVSDVEKAHAAVSVLI